MLLEFERPAVKRPGHVEGGIAVFEAAVAKRHDHLPFRDDAAVEIGNAMIRSVAHRRTTSNSGARVSANSSTAPASLSASSGPIAIDRAIMPRFANQMPRARRSK